MVDIETLLLDVGGWIVAGLVTLAGVLTAHRLRQRSEQAHEDRKSVYEPLYQEMQRILDGAETGRKYGTLLWSPSDDFNWLVSRGVLLAKRFETIDGPVEEMKRTYGGHRESWNFLTATARNAYQNTFDGTMIVSKEPSRATVADVLGHDLSDSAMYNAIVSGNVDAVAKRIGELLASAGERLGEPVLILPPMNSDSMALAILRETERSRAKYLEDADVFVQKVATVNNLLFEHLRT